MSLLLYPAVIEKTREGFAVFFPGLACGGAGATIAAAVADAEQGLAVHLDAAAEAGIELPPPAEIDKIRVEPDIDEVARLLVRYEPPAQSVRKSGIAVGTLIAERPPHRTGRAAFPHPAPTLGV